MVDFLAAAAGAYINPKEVWKLGVPLVKAELLAFQNAQASGNRARDRVMIPLQPTYIIQQIVDKYFLREMGSLHDLASSNQSLAQNFDQIFKKDLGVSIKDDARTILNHDLSLPNYFRNQVNTDGSLSVNLDGLKLVYAAESQRLAQASSKSLDLQKIIDDHQRQSPLSSASLKEILQRVPADVQAQQRALYEENRQLITSAAAGIKLASNLAGLFSGKAAQEIGVVGNAAVQITTGINDLAYGSLGITGGLTAAGNVAQGILQIYTLFKGGPSSDDAIVKQLQVLAAQLDRLRQEMHTRFDILDRRIMILYESINTRLDKLDFDVATAINKLTELQGDLNRFERNFYELIIKSFLTDLDSSITGGIAYRETYGFNMIAQQFAMFENAFYRGVMETARDAIIPGTRRYDDASIFQELVPGLDKGDLALFPDGANSELFRRYPQERFGLMPLYPGPIGHPSVEVIAGQGHHQARI